MSDASSQGLNSGTAPVDDPAADAAAQQAQAMLLGADAQEPVAPPAPAQQAQAPAAPVQQPAPQAPAGGGQQVQQPQQPQAPVLSEYAQGILKDATPEEQAILQPYLSKWDANVTRRFQEVQSTWAPLQPYVEQGFDPQEIALAVQLYQLADEDPQAAMNLLSQALGVPAGSGPQQQFPAPQQPQFQQPAPAGQPGAPADMSQQQYAQLSPEVQQQLAQSTQFQQQFALWFQQQQAETQQQQEDAALDQYVTNLHQEFGDFDENAVLVLMQTGLDGGAAVQAWKAQFDQYATAQGLAPQQQQQAPPPPTVLNGGAAPTGQQEITQMSDKERKSRVAEMLQAAQ